MKTYRIKPLEVDRSGKFPQVKAIDDTYFFDEDDGEVTIYGHKTDMPLGNFDTEDEALAAVEAHHKQLVEQLLVPVEGCDEKDNY